MSRDERTWNEMGSRQTLIVLLSFLFFLFSQIYDRQTRPAAAHNATGNDVVVVVDGQLQSSSRFKIVNVVGEGGRAVDGFWTPAVGTTPGNSTTVARGWEIPMTRKKLQICVTLKKRFEESGSDTGEVTVTGYCFDVFKAVMDAFPNSLPYEFVPCTAASYGDLVSQVYFKRSKYSDSGASMMAPEKEQKNKSPRIWYFRRFGGLFLITGCVSTLALLCFLLTFVYKEWDVLKTLVFESSYWKRVVGWACGSNCKELDSHGFENYGNGGGSNDSNLNESPNISVISYPSNMNDGSLDKLATGGQAAQSAIEITEISDGN